MNEIVLRVTADEATGHLVARWDDPAGGALSVEGSNLEEMLGKIPDAVAAHFPNGESNIRVRVDVSLVRPELKQPSA